MLRDGDVIQVDIPNRLLQWKVDQGELEQRRQGWKAPAQKIDRGYLARYARMVTSAHTGAVLQDP